MTTTAKGFNGTLSFDGQTVTIERKGVGTLPSKTSPDLPVSRMMAAAIAEGNAWVARANEHFGDEITQLVSGGRAYGSCGSAVTSPIEPSRSWSRSPRQAASPVMPPPTTRYL